jgi:lipopolysaccharide-induced tumor necrosis factor-alpha factor
MNSDISPAITCPACQFTGAPILKKQVSVGGWILFAALLVFFFPLMWLPFVLDGCKETVRICPGCGRKHS